jgi:hypothetical protein
MSLTMVGQLSHGVSLLNEVLVSLLVSDNLLFHDYRISTQALTFRTTAVVADHPISVNLSLDSMVNLVRRSSVRLTIARYHLDGRTFGTQRYNDCHID